jgi:hypothetical protein
VNSTGQAGQAVVGDVGNVVNLLSQRYMAFLKFRDLGIEGFYFLLIIEK